jgi:hypothetical protein
LVLTDRGIPPAQVTEILVLRRGYYDSTVPPAAPDTQLDLLATKAPPASTKTPNLNICDQLRAHKLVNQIDLILVVVAL